MYLGLPKKKYINNNQKTSKSLKSLLTFSVGLAP